MTLTFVTGGARSGKSSHALRLAAAAGKPVTMIATAEARDAEMAERIAAHRRERPPGWRTVEEPVDLTGALRGLAAGEFAIVDCLSLWVSNLLERNDAAAIADVAARIATSRAPAILVTNEVGSGIIPFEPETRRYRDALGTANQRLAEVVDDVVLMVAGRPLSVPAR